MKTNNIISLITESASSMRQKIESLTPLLIVAAQEVYNEWKQDEEGYDEVYGSGGICDDIAGAMGAVISKHTDYSFHTQYDEYECHTSIYVYSDINREAFHVDIPPYVYEKGFGYSWKKIPDVTFAKQHVVIAPFDYEDLMNMVDY